MLGCISVTENLRAKRGYAPLSSSAHWTVGLLSTCLCARCRASEESKNLVFLNVHGLCKCGIYLKGFIEPIHFLFSITFRKHRLHVLEGFSAHGWALILGLIVYFERKNNKVFSNIDNNPIDTLKLAETESLIWVEAQASITQSVTQSRELEVTSLLPIPGKMVFYRWVIIRTW